MRIAYDFLSVSAGPLVAEATRAAAAGGGDEEGRGPLEEDAGVALVAGATCAAAAGGDDEGRAGLGLPPCQAVAEDPGGAFTSATAEGGGRYKASATTFAFPTMCLTSEMSSAMDPKHDAGPVSMVYGL